MTTTHESWDSTALRDLTDQDFQRRYDTDRFTASVLGGRMRYAVQHMCSGLLAQAFSQIMRDWYDFAATISGPPELNYPMSSVSNSLTLFLGTMDDGLRNTVEEYGPENLRPGDVLICNDPYRAGNHVNDILFIRPIFADGRLVSFITLRAHQLDMGGVVPAGFSGTKRNVYENGLVLGPMLLYRDDEPLESTFNLIFDNARFCALLLPDIKSIYQNLKLGEKQLLNSIDRYGIDAYLGAVRYNCDVSADAMREGLRNLPDGVYEAEEGIDCDGIDDSIEYRLKLKITKVGDKAEFDFSGSSEQARTSINASVLDTKTAVGVAMKFLIDPDTPFNSGSYRDLDIVLPAGTFLSATPPDGAVFIYWESSDPVVLAIFQALQSALGDHAVGGDYGSLSIHNANGVSADGTPWVTTAQCGGEHGPWGATRDGDADSYTAIYSANNLDPATEAIESDVPVVLLRKGYVPDTCGEGTNRGGASVIKDTLWLTDTEHWSSPVHTKRSSGIGVNGGADGRAGAVWVFSPEHFDVTKEKNLLPLQEYIYQHSTPVAGVLDPDSKTPDPAGEYFYFANPPIWHTEPHSVFRYITNGGGGWGDPVQRDPERVKRDVRDEYVTIDGAYRDYGVVVLGDPVSDPEGLQVDQEATARRRAQLSTTAP